MRGKTRTWSDDQLLDAIARSTNFTDVVRALGLRAAGGNHRTVKKHAKRLNADTSHFTNDRRVRGLRAHGRGVELAFNEVFRIESRVCSQVLRRHVCRRQVLAAYQCAECGNPGTHNGKPLTLQLDHANGIYNDNRVENLRWLCPNCHSQTETFAGRRSRHGYRIMRDQQQQERQAAPPGPRRVSEPVSVWWRSTCHRSAPYSLGRTPERGRHVAG